MTIIVLHSLKLKTMTGSNFEKLKKEAERLARLNDWGMTAITVNNQLLELNKNEINAYTRLAKCFNLRGDKERARDLYRLALKIDPKKRYSSKRNK